MATDNVSNAGQISEASNLILEQAKKSRETLANAQARAESASAEIADTNAILKSGVQKSQGLTDVMTKAIESIAASTGIEAWFNDTAQLKTQNLNIAAFKEAGGAEYQRQLMGELELEAKQLEDLRNRQADIADDTFTGFGFIDGVINAFRSVQVDQQTAIARRKFTETLQTVQAITAGTEAVNKANLLTAETVNAATIASNQRKIAATADLDAARIERDNLHSNAQAISTLQTANARAIASEIEVYKLHEEVADRELKELQRQATLQELDIRMKKAPLEIEQMKVTLARNQQQLKYETNPTTVLALQKKNEELIKQIDDAAVVEVDAASYVQDGQSITGIPVTEDPAVVAAWRNSRDPNEVAKYNMLYTVGKTGYLGSTPYDSAAALHFIDPLNQGKNSPLRILIEAAKQQISIKAKDPKFVAPKDETSSRQLFNDTARQVRESYHSQINFGDRSNPFQAPPMDTLAALAAVNTTELYTKVLAPMNLREVNPQQILEATIAAVQNKTLNPNKAAEEYSTIFKAAIKYNNDIYGGISRGGFAPQSAYNTPVSRARTPYEITTGTAGNIIKSAFEVIPVVYGYKKFKEEFLQRPPEEQPVPTYTETVDVSDEVKVRELITKYMSQARNTGQAGQ